MRTASVFAVAALFAGLSLRQAEAGIVRCESADGRVTYSNKECPPDTRAARSLELSPPVVVHDKPGAAAKPGGTAATGKAAGKATGNDPELRAQLAKQRAECEARGREIDSLRQDRDGAEGDARAAAQLALRRSEDDYRALCPRRR